MGQRAMTATAEQCTLTLIRDTDEHATKTTLDRLVRCMVALATQFAAPALVLGLKTAVAAKKTL
ncbi:MAG: hypothetical protein V2I33_19075, partial [Kangiellaceae bacterium]|nr:hypothetical protein [Kangiellaceae bacterium]